MSLTAGKKPNWAREIDSDNYQDIFGLSASDAEKLGLVIGHAVMDTDGNKRIVLHCTSYETSELTWANYANVPVGSVVIMPSISTPAMFLKVGTAGAATDWKKVAINTVVS